ncbi:RodZ domain-containing protein [Phytohalomonas tamaricis]|uniref:RodZ domain-containing protein n=1 Tax=Phytohalomonas tamaricis TaxID=2081032 RepID=UPI000D0B6E7B|nr:RodZ domain-containing protein [Phytohalomonas tamaricis]
MSEYQEHSSTPQTDRSPGEMLRAEREYQGLSTDEVAEQLNLRPSLVTDLEASRFDQIPVPAYQRGYLRSYARLLGMDERMVVHAYDRVHGRDDIDERRITPIQTVRPPSRLGKIIFRLVTVLIILGLIGLTLLWWQSRQGTPSFSEGNNEPSVTQQDGPSTSSLPPLPESSVETRGPTVAESPATPAATSLNQSADVDVAVASQVSEQAGTTGDTPSNEGKLQVPAVEGQNGSAGRAVAESQAEQSTQNNDPNVLQFTFNQESWTEVRDASGQRVFSGLQKAGTQAEVHGRPPFRMTVGNASGVVLHYRGETVDLQKNARSSNVAKFTLGE